MQLSQLLESSTLTSYKNWKIPQTKELKDTFDEFQKSKASKSEIYARTILTPTELFVDFQDFSNKVLSGKILEVDKAFLSKVLGTSSVTTISSLRSLVSAYDRPRDITRLVDGFKNGDKIPMPIIIQGQKGMRILSGNARCNASLVLGFKPKVIIVDLSMEASK